MRRFPLALLAAVTLAACTGGLPPWSTAQREDYPREAQAALAGEVRVPKDLVYRPSPSLGPNDAPSPAPSGSEWPVVDADVFVSDAGGTRIPGIPRVQTNADGRYRLAGVPLGYPYVVNAIYRDSAGRALRLRALAAPSSGDQAVDLSTATTIVAYEALYGASGLIGRYDADAWQRAVAALDRGLQAGGYPDLGDWYLVDEARKRVEATDPQLSADLVTLRAALAVKSAGQGSPSPSPSPQSSPRSQSSSSPPPITSAAPSS